jgi:hypothetical protein
MSGKTPSINGHQKAPHDSRVEFNEHRDGLTNKSKKKLTKLGD